MPAQSPGNGQPPQKRRGKPSAGGAKTVGAWLPWATVEQVCRLDLRPSSRWRVFLAVLCTSARYGGQDARLGVQDLVRMTGLAKRTVKAALAQLCRQGLLARVGRYCRLRVNLGGRVGEDEGASLPAPPGSIQAPAGGASLSAPPRCRQACTSPTCIYVSSFKEVVVGEASPLSPNQKSLVADVLAEASESLGFDAADLSLADTHCALLGVLPATTYRQAWGTVAASADGARLRDFTKAVLALRQDERVQGTELRLAPR